MDPDSEDVYSDDFQDDATDGLSADIDQGPPVNGITQGTFAHNTFDAYFAQNHKPSRTSSNVFSNFHVPLTAQEYLSAIASAKYARPISVPWLHKSSRDKLFHRLLFETEQGFNLLFYGAGSKRKVLNALATHLNGEHHDVVVANAFHPSFTIRDLLLSIETTLPADDDLVSAAVSMDAQLKKILDYLSLPNGPNHIYLVIHNIDSPSLRNARAKACLGVLAAAPRVHILASVDNIAFPSLWSLTEAFARKRDWRTNTGVHQTPFSGYAWQFHDLTTLEPYNFELIHADRSSLSGAHQASKPTRARKGLSGASSGTVTEDAARHILLSVTQKARKLFLLLGTKQLEAMTELDAASTDPQQLAFEYGMLFNMARDDFVAMNDTALRALMGEFKDHGLMVSIAQGTSGTEAIWIPLRRETLFKILNELRQ